MGVRKESCPDFVKRKKKKKIRLKFKALTL